MPKLPSRSTPSRRQKVARAGKTLVRAWPLISLFRRTVGFARLGPFAVPALLGAAVFKLLRRRKRKQQEAAMPSDPFAAPAPSAPSRGATGDDAGGQPAPDPSAPAPGDDRQQTGSLPESDDDANPQRADSEGAPKPDRAAPEAAGSGAGTGAHPPASPSA